MSVGADSMAKVREIDFGESVRATAPVGAPSVLVVCEHASNRIPDDLNNLGLSDEAVQSHVAWDPGALGVAQTLARRLNAVFVEGRISRLVYDCNRPPEAASAIPEVSEIYQIPGNRNLTAEDRSLRVTGVFTPFSQALSDEIARYSPSLKLMVTATAFD